jgi:exosortase/archaeosortase family protein
VLFIWHPCNGLVLYALFSGFIVAFPGPARRKLWFIPLGLFLIYSLNVLRVIALSINTYYDHKSADFNHHYTFTAVVYASIFALWMWWATRGASASRRPAAESYVAA